MNINKPVASLSLDLDNLWSYMKTHGDPRWESYPSFLERAVPRILDFLQQRNLTITFFVVGQDAALSGNHDALRAIAEAGHEIGNHSLYHEPWLHLYSDDRIEAELSQAEEHIQQVAGKKPLGFRGPGYSCSEAILRILARRGYVYDASTLPTFLGPLARTYYFLKSPMSAEEKQKRRKLFGTFKDGLRPLRPYMWHLNDHGSDDRILEIPVTTMPIFKLPVHASYILYLSTLSPGLAMTYFRVAMLLCRLTGVQPSLLLHPHDFLSSEDVSELSFFPAMNLSNAKKLGLLDQILRLLSERFTVLPMHEHALYVTRTDRLPMVKPSFNTGQTV